MNIEFAVTGISVERHVAELTRQVITKAAADIEVSIDWLSLVLIADDDHYADAVQRIQPGGSFTQHQSGMRGMGKTHTKRDSDGVLRSSIVINLNAWGAAMATLFEDLKLPKRNELGEQLSLYLIYHELGHCKDDQIRPGRASPTICRAGRGFEIHHITRYYADILEEEYAANAWAAPWMNSIVYENSIHALGEALAILRKEGKELIEQFQADQTDLTTLASTVAGWSWFLLIQFAKTCASRRVNPVLKEAFVDIWPEPDDIVLVQLLREFEAELDNHWRGYPAWTGEPPAFLRQTWEAFALLEGFRFQEDEDGSAVFF